MNLHRLRELAGFPALNESAAEVQQLNGFKKGDRVVITDTQSKPPQTYNGEIKAIFDDEYAQIQFDSNLTPQASQSLKDNGRVALNKIRKAK